MDILLELWVCGLIEMAKWRHRRTPVGLRQSKDKLKLLFFGYNGGRNTGADVRVHEMIRQISHIIGPQNADLSVVTLSPELTRGYFGDTRQIELPDVFPPFLGSEIPRYDGLIACEGSMFKSKFADALTTMMVGALGMSTACKRLSVAYGAEAGKMNPMPRWMTSRYCRDSFVIARSQESAEVLHKLGVPAQLGADTAWTFQPSPPSQAEQSLRAAGWDGQAPVLAICPINPFWWPVSASFRKYFEMLAFGKHKDSHFGTYYFHKTGPEVERAYRHYLNSIAAAVSDFRREQSVFPILVAMEKVDDHACNDLAALFPSRPPIFSSRQISMFDLVAILRRSSMLLSSRYHAIVTSMPGLVPSAGITMDERIRNLMHQRNQMEMFTEVDQPDLKDRVLQLLKVLHGDSQRIRDGIERAVFEQLRGMGQMGMAFAEHVRGRFPDLALPQHGSDWKDYLPSHSPELQSLIGKF